MAKSMHYLVAVEWPCDWSSDEGRRALTVVVTDQMQGFGPDLMAKVDGHLVPIRGVNGFDPKEIAMSYIADHGVADLVGRIKLNLPEEFREWEWRTEPGWALME